MPEAAILQHVAITAVGVFAGLAAFLLVLGGIGVIVKTVAWLLTIGRK